LDKLFAEVDKGAAEAMAKFTIDQIERETKSAKRTASDLKGSLAFLEKSTLKNHVLGYACSTVSPLVAHT
jgi:hypothetical protein